MNKKHIVIIGGGFGGVNTYKSLPASVKESCDITIIDKRNHFVFTPLLPEVAGANLDQHNIVEPLRDIIDSSVNFIQSTVIAVDTKEQKIELSDGELSYDVLVSALGSKTFFFGTPGAEEHAFVLKTLEDAVTIRNRCIDIFEKASRIDDALERKKLLTFIIVGGGPTGVELAGEIADLFFDTFVRQFNTISTEDISLILVDSNEHLVSMFDRSLQKYAEEALVKDKVTLRPNVRVTEVTAEGIITSEGERIDAPTVIWTAGVTANTLTCSSSLFEVVKGRIMVDEYLQAQHAKNVFVIGDMALVPTADGRGLPMTAQIAKQQGIATGKNIERLLEGQPLEKFVYQEKGLLASLGTYDAIAQIKGFKLKGVVAWFLWRTIYLFNFASWKKRFQIMGDWTINLFTRRDTTRL